MEEARLQNLAVTSQTGILLVQALLDLLISKDIVSGEDAVLLYARLARHAEGLGGVVNDVVAEKARALALRPAPENDRIDDFRCAAAR